MPLIPVDPNRTSWREGVTVIGKIGKPGCKPLIHGNGRTSLNFTVRIKAGAPFMPLGGKAQNYNDFNFRCMWFDPDTMLNTSDVVEVTGVVSRMNNGDLSLLVNKLEVLARFIPKS